MICDTQMTTTNAKREVVLNFPEWLEVLAASELPERQKESVRVTVRWFLSFTKRGRVPVTHQSARDFIGLAQAEKDPPAAQ